jgi:hypothetical protein
MVALQANLRGAYGGGEGVNGSEGACTAKRRRERLGRGVHTLKGGVHTLKGGVHTWEGGACMLGGGAHAWGGGRGEGGRVCLGGHTRIEGGTCA